jgi:hypothetical protein
VILKTLLPGDPVSGHRSGKCCSSRMTPMQHTRIGAYCQSAQTPLPFIHLPYRTVAAPGAVMMAPAAAAPASAFRLTTL